jgi:predicted metal-dependent enzyme (double-stranded beta helix superfamily)
VFDLDQFVSDCRSALRQESAHPAVREVVARAVSEPASVLRSLGEPTRGGLYILHQSPELTILNVVWPPWMTLLPHNHLMWAVIGVYTGREDNVFWRRIRDRRDGKVEAARARALCVGDAEPLGRDVIHSVTNPIPRLTGAIHVYGGDFFAVARSEWDAETLLEAPSEGAKMARRLEEANALFLKS